MADVDLRPARPDEAAALSELALRSKAHWGYSDDFIEACRDELTVSRDVIVSGHAVVAELAGGVVGFATVSGEPPIQALDMLFVEPAHIGAGVGGALFALVRADALDAGFTRLHIEADPNAIGFYEHHGAMKVGEEPSASIPGRTLPCLVLEL